jgi:hypothetical protein
LAEAGVVHCIKSGKTRAEHCTVGLPPKADLIYSVAGLPVWAITYREQMQHGPISS